MTKPGAVLLLRWRLDPEDRGSRAVPVRITAMHLPETHSRRQAHTPAPGAVKIPGTDHTRTPAVGRLRGSQDCIADRLQAWRIGRTVRLPAGAESPPDLNRRTA